MKRILQEHPRLAAAGAAGLVVFLALFGRSFMAGSRPQPLDRDEITARALEFAALEGWTVAPRFAWTYAVEGDDFAAVRESAAATGAAVPDRETLPDPMWETAVVANPDVFVSRLRAFKGPDPVLMLEATPRGEVVFYVEATSPISGTPIAQFQSGDRPIPFRELHADRLFEVLPEERLAPTDEERARATELAEAFFARHGVSPPGPPASFDVRAWRDSSRLAYMRWHRPGPAGAFDLVRIAIWSDRVVAFDRDIRVGLASVEEPRTNAAIQLLNALPLLFLFFASAVITVLVILRRRQGEIDLRSAAIVALANAAGTAVLTVGWLGITTGLMMPIAGHQEIWLGVINVVIVVPIVIAISSFVLAGAWATGEGQAYLVWPQHLIRPFSAFVRGRLRTPEAAEPVAIGYALAATALGAVVLLGMVTPPSPVPSIAPFFSLFYWPMSVTIPLQALSMAFSLTITAGLFAMTYTRMRTRRAWVVVIVGTCTILLIRGAFAATQFFPADPRTATWVAVALAVALAAAFVRYGPVTMLTAVYVYVTAITAYPLVLSGNTGHALSGAWALLLGLAPAGIAAFGALRPVDKGMRRAVPAHVRRALDRLRITEEFEVARLVQSRLLPAAAPVVPGLDVAGVCVPASEVGGDYFDYFKLEDGRLGVAIGDVSGKGVGAAIYMTLTKSYMVTQSTYEANTARMLGRVNEHLRRNLARGTFVTMVYAVVDAASRSLEYTRAGHNPPLHIRANGEGDFLNAPGLALGAAAARTFDAVTRIEVVELQPGDLVVLYTDGVTEAMNLRSEEYGEERLIALVRRLAQSPASSAAVVDALLRDVRGFTDRAPQHDDITIVVIRVEPDTARQETTA
jgi:serine phosphatase RsbU (regulator of sigma subunit)